MINVNVTVDTDDMDPYLRLVDEAVNDGVTNAARVVAEQQRSIIQRMSGTLQAATARAGGARSAPGNPPFVQTGRLRDSIGWTEARNLVARAGSHMRGTPPTTGPDGEVNDGHSYGYFLEFGTSWMRARPWARRGLQAAINSGAASRAFRKAAMTTLRRGLSL